MLRNHQRRNQPPPLRPPPTRLAIEPTPPPPLPAHHEVPDQQAHQRHRTRHVERSLHARRPAAARLPVRSHVFAAQACSPGEAEFPAELVVLSRFGSEGAEAYGVERRG